MTATEKKILETFKKVIPKLTEKQRERLLGFSEGMEYKTEQQERKSL